MKTHNLPGIRPHRPLKPHNSTWNRRSEALLTRMWKKGRSYKHMCEKLDMSDNMIRSKLERMGLTYIKREGPDPKHEAVDEIKKKMGIGEKFNWEEF